MKDTDSCTPLKLGNFDQYMSIWQQVHQLIVKEDIHNIQRPIITSNHPISQQLVRFWNTRTQSEQRTLIVSSVAIALVIYILYPSISPKKKEEMFSKRPDKHTTGLINMRNDCFANSSIQAYSALPGLTEYLNKFISSVHDFDKFVKKNNLKQSDFKHSDSKKDGDKTTEPTQQTPDLISECSLHVSLARIMKKLQETQMTSRTISVWTFLHSLEKIFNAKISRSQHDAHELTQLINETLENENLKLIKKFKTLKKNLINVSELYSKLDDIEIPEFPFSGLIHTQMKCLSCKYVSKPSFSPFLMLTLHTPEKLSTDLEDLLYENESESIDGYQCLKCRLIKIIDNENYLSEKGKPCTDSTEKEIIEKLSDLNNNENLCINEDLSEELEDYVKSYNKGGLDISKITSTVFRKTQILKPPKLFGIHLSRSSFNGVNITRNPCRVSFKDSLNLSIGKEYHEELKEFQTAARESEADTSHIKSTVLTTDLNDMEDEENQREDFDEKGDEDEEDDTTEATASDGDDDDENDDSEVSSLTSAESLNTINTPPVLQKKLTRDSDVSSKVGRVQETLNNAPISSNQTDDLKKYFRQFKFNDNDIYKYRLRAVIRHQGSHAQGHYECYKKKPLFVKNKEGNIIKLSPEIHEDVLEETKAAIENAAVPSTSGGRKRNVSISLSDPFGTSQSSDKSRTSSNGSFENSGIREKFSSMMGRRPSVFQADPEHANIQEIVDSGLNTPAELLVDDINADYFANYADSFNDRMEKIPENKPTNNTQKKVRMKKIPSSLKNPFWRISDAQVSEVSRASVLCETTSVYMLYYERVDRKQVKNAS